MKNALDRDHAVAEDWNQPLSMLLISSALGGDSSAELRISATLGVVGGDVVV